MRRSLKGSGKNAITRVLIALLLILAGALLMMPFYFMFLSSLKPGTEILRLGLSFQFDPGVSSFTNYAALNTYRDGIYWKWYQSSLVIMVLQTSVGLFFSSIVGYALAMYHFKGRRAVDILVLILLMMPVHAKYSRTCSSQTSVMIWVR